MSTLTRREFLKYSGGAVLLAALGSPALAACQTAPPLARADGGVASTGLAAGLDTAGSSDPRGEVRPRRVFKLDASLPQHLLC